MSQRDGGRASRHLGWASVVVLALTALFAAASCEERLPPGFPHAVHFTTKKCGGENEAACPTCTSCHTTMLRAEGPKSPSENECKDCHKNDVKEKMAKVDLAATPHSNITFPHDKHLPMPKIAGQCMDCHKGVPEDGTRGGIYPPMAQCLTCHSAAFETATCTPCHQRSDLVGLVPKTVLRHDVAFMRNHGAAFAAGMAEATRHVEVCSQCHSQESCTACHDDSQTLALDVRRIDKIDKMQHHRGDFVARHNIEAASSPATCTSCHQMQFCNDCHTVRGVGADAIGAVSPHPIGWVGTDTSSANFHGRSARRDILACASCHDQGPATNCIRCHRVGGQGGNPHPGGWRSSRSMDEPMCGYCHGP